MFKYDIYRYYGKYSLSFFQKLFMKPELKFLKYFRKINSTSILFLKYFYRFKLLMLSYKTHIQIPYSTKIGKGFYIGHFGRIIINSNSIIGNNCNIGTGVTIGIENRGKRKGTPIIGDNVWIGTNSVIVGNIIVGNDVLIAPNSFVNFNVPDHSVVVGNPAKIIKKRNATECYINNMVEMEEIQ